MTAIAHQPHPVTRALAGARDQLHAVAEVPVWSMDPAETTAAIHELDALAAQVAELQARLLRHADRTELAANTGATSTANWYAHHTRTTRRPRTGRCGSPRASRTTTPPGPRSPRAGCTSSRPRPSSAPWPSCPTTSTPSSSHKQSSTCSSRPPSFDAKALKHLGRRILEVIDPETADAHEAKLLEREERDAAAATRLMM